MLGLHLQMNPLPQRRRPVALLHGFPDGPESWTVVADQIRAGGHEVHCPPFPGYGERHLPWVWWGRGVEDAVCRRLPSADEGIHVVGHDWGGVFAWLMSDPDHDDSERYRYEVRSLSVISAPHPCRVQAHVAGPASNYARFLARRWVPELWLRFKGYAPLLAPLRAAGMSEAALDAVLLRCSDKVRLREMLGPYRERDFPKHWSGSPPWVPEIPTLLLRGEHDPYVSAEHMLPPSAGHADLRVEMLPGIGHWPQLQAPEALAAKLLSFWAKVDSAVQPDD